METKYFPMSETIGFEVKTAKDIFAAKELGMIIRNEDDYDFDDMVTNTNEDGEEEEREPTEDEMTNRAIELLNNGGKVYATIYPSNYKLIDKRATTLQTNFYVGQQVYIMHENKIRELYVQRVILTTSYAYDKTNKPNDRGISIFAKDAVGKYVSKNVGVTERYLNVDEQQQLLLLARKETWKHPSIEGQICFAYHTFGIYPTDEVFATKDELVKHLLED